MSSELDFDFEPLCLSVLTHCAGELDASRFKHPDIYTLIGVLKNGERNSLSSLVSSIIGQIRGGVEADGLECPICYCVFDDPVMASDGHTYCYKCITECLKTSKNSPITREVLNGVLKSNYAVKKMIKK